MEVEDNKTESPEVKMDEKKEVDNRVAEWLFAEMKRNLDTAMYLYVEVSSKLKGIEETERVKVVESKLESVSEKIRPLLKDKDVEEIDRFIEAMKSEPAEKGDKPVPQPEAKKPGEEGYKRSFL